MVINDLKTICPQCRGSGKTAGITNLGISNINLVGDCPNCGSRGFRLTELGEDVVKLLRPFIGEMIQTAQETQTGKETAQAAKDAKAAAQDQHPGMTDKGE